MKKVMRPVKMRDEVLHRDIINHKNIIRIKIARESRHSIEGSKLRKRIIMNGSIFF